MSQDEYADALRNSLIFARRELYGAKQREKEPYLRRHLEMAHKSCVDALALPVPDDAQQLRPMEDTERLNWLEENHILPLPIAMMIGHEYQVNGEFYSTLREAIDAAMGKIAQ